MSNLNVDALKKLFPKNTTRRQGGKVSGANRKRVQVMLPPDTLARLDELIEHDEQARSAAVALGVEVLNLVLGSERPWEETQAVIELLNQLRNPRAIYYRISLIHSIADRVLPEDQP